LLRLDPPGRPAQRTTEVRLTDTGARVLAGEADRVALNGIDRWIGGVHLQGHDVPWRWDDAVEALVRSLVPAAASASRSSRRSLP
jgi:hypothetical protein